MGSTQWIVAGLACALVAGCVVMPTAPSLSALPGSQKNFEQFRADDGACREYAHMLVSGPGYAAAGNAANNAALGTMLGAAAGALIGSVSGNAGEGAAIGAGTGLFFGSAAGSDYAGYSSYQLQRQYDFAYVQCMYDRGHRVPAAYVYRQAPTPSYAAPRYPPPDYPAPRMVPPGEAPAPAAPSPYPPATAPVPR